MVEDVVERAVIGRHHRGTGTNAPCPSTATFLRDRPVKFTIGLVVFTFMLSIGVLGRSEESVLQLSTTICILASLASIALFLFLVDYALKALRPVSVVAGVAAEGFKVLEDVYPHLLGTGIDGGARSSRRSRAPPIARKDPIFAFRILVDIAAKALSPAINGPTTAVLAIDQIHRLLRSVGRRHLDTEAILDESGTLGSRSTRATGRTT